VNNELQHISKRLTGLIMKRPGLALGLWGEPGIGKTHTALALLRGTPCQTKTVHATQALEKILLQLPRPKKLTLWLEKILERLLRGETLEIGILNQALVGLLAANAPIVLHVEDLHEANPERLEFWQQLAQSVTRTRGVGLIVTSRAQAPENFEDIRLSALTREESDALLEAEVSAKLPSEALSWLFERSAGNPLFTLEFFRLLARQGSLWNDGKRWRFRKPMSENMPVTVEALIEQTVTRAMTDMTLRDVIHAKAMLGREVATTLWAAVAGLKIDTFDTAISQLECEGLITSGEFAHPLYGEVIAQNISKEERKLRAQRAIKEYESIPEAILKFIDDVNLGSVEAIILLKTAAKKAKDKKNTLLEGKLLAKAIFYAQGDEKGDLALQAAILLRQVDEATSLELSKQATMFLSDNIKAIYTHADLLARQGNAKEAQNLLDQMPKEEKDSLRWLENVIITKALTRDPKSVIEIWNLHPNLHTKFPFPVLTKVAMALIRVRETQEALALVHSVLERDNLKPQEQDELRFVAGVCYQHLDDFEKAEGMFRESISFLRSEKLNQRLLTVLNSYSFLLGETNQHQEALSASYEALEIAESIGNTIYRAYSQYILGNLLTILGDYSKAEEFLTESYDVLSHVTPMGAFVDCQMYLCDLYKDWSLPYSLLLIHKYATSACISAESIGQPHYINATYLNLASSKSLNGESEKGLYFSSKALEYFINHGQLWDIREARYIHSQCLKVSGRWDEALMGFREAQKVAIQMGGLYKLQLIELEIDHLNNDLKSARGRLKWFEEHGLMNGVNIAHRYFPELKTESHHTPLTLSSEFVPHLEVLGAMQTKLESQTTPVRGRKRQELLALLLEARISGRGEVSKLELVDKLYPDTDEIQANAGLRDVIYQLRSSLGESTLMTTMNGYALGSLKTDVETFLETGNTQLWRGVYLEGLTLETSDTVRESLYLALRTRAEAVLETDPNEVTRVGRLLCEADPYDLEALRLTVTGLRALQNHRSLTRFYNSARTRFLEIGEMLPARWQDFLTAIGTTA
jgi:tetratricopeptide (TPR) repeat protein